MYCHQPFIQKKDCVQLDVTASFFNILQILAGDKPVSCLKNVSVAHTDIEHNVDIYSIVKENLKLTIDRPQVKQFVLSKLLGLNRKKKEELLLWDFIKEAYPSVYKLINFIQINHTSISNNVWYLPDGYMCRLKTKTINNMHVIDTRTILGGLVLSLEGFITRELYYRLSVNVKNQTNSNMLNMLSQHGVHYNYECGFKTFHFNNIAMLANYDSFIIPYKKEKLLKDTYQSILYNISTSCIKDQLLRQVFDNSYIHLL